MSAQEEIIKIFTESDTAERIRIIKLFIDFANNQNGQSGNQCKEQPGAGTVPEQLGQTA